VAAAAAAERSRVAHLAAAPPARNLAPAAIALLCGTFVSVLNSTIVNVPLRDIARDLRVSIASASLLVTTFGLTFAALMPLAGWAGNRYGRRRVFCLGTAVLGGAGLAAIAAPNLPALVVLRIIQGAASAAVTPLVMQILAELFEPAQRTRALSGWAAANGLGQAIGPPLGGLLSAALTWRSIFAPTPIIAWIACAAALRFVPADAGRAIPLDRRGAAGLTLGAALLLAAFASAPEFGFASPLFALLAAGGIVLLAAFVRATRTDPHPFVSPDVIREPGYVRGCIGVMTGTFSLGASLLGFPLFLTHVLGYSTASAGIAALALPIALVVSTQPVSRAIRRFGSRAALAAGLLILAAASAAFALLVLAPLHLAALLLAMCAVGVGLAFVHAATAVGITDSAAGRYGAGVGLYNLLRIAGSTLGAAWVGTEIRSAASSFAVIFAGCAVVALCGLAVTRGFGRENPKGTAS
jgi:predicted MFS family arabinose efflux permease